MAVKVVVAPLGIEAATGETVMLVNVAAVTVMLTAGDVMPLIDAVTVVLPIATPVTVPGGAPTLAVAVSADVHLTCAVMSAVELSEKVPVAVRLAVVPLARVADAGVMAMLESVTGGVEVTSPLLLPPPPHAASATTVTISEKILLQNK